MKKSKYIILTPFFPSNKHFAGAFIYDQAKALKKAGMDVVVLKVGGIFEKEADYEYNGIQVKYFPMVGSPSYILNGIFDRLNRIIFSFWFCRQFKNFKVSAIHAHTLSTSIAALYLKDKFPNAICMLQHHDLDPYTVLNGKWSDKKWNIRYRAKKAIKNISKFDLHICVSKRVEENLFSFPMPGLRDIYGPYIERLKLIGTRKFKPTIKDSYVLINGVDKTKFYPQSKNDRQSGKFAIGCIANYIPLKRHELLLKAFKQILNIGVRDIRLVLVGKNPYSGYENIKSLARQLNIDQFIEFKENCDHTKLNQFYNSIDLFVLPSVFEGLGCVFLEAAACGIPFITIENQGISDYIIDSEKPMWLSKPDDVDDLAAKILNVIEKPTKQTLSQDIDIDIQISNFIEYLNLKNERVSH